MRIISLRLVDLIKNPIPIGFVGENVHTQIQVDCKKVFDEYPAAVASLAVRSPGSLSPYPAVVERNGDVVIWTVRDSDLVHEGKGELQLSFVVDEVVVKSYVGRTKILRSIMPTGDVPDRIDDWITEANAVLGEIPQTISDSVDTALAEAKASGEFDGPKGDKGDPGNDGFSPYITTSKLPSGNGYWLHIVNKNNSTHIAIEDGKDGKGIQSIAKTGTSGRIDTYTITYTDGQTTTFTVTNGANGAPGTDGFSPIATVTKSGKVATISITDKNGTTTATVSDGEDGNPTSIIDDTAGAGDTNKTFSASKLTSEFSDVKSAIEQIDSDLADVENDLSELFTEAYQEYLYCVAYNANYWQAALTPQLQSGTKYRMVITATSTFHLDDLQMGTSGTSASMVDTIASNVDFAVGENVFLYTPSTTGLLFIRVVGNAGNISSIKFYTINKTSKADVALSEISEINGEITGISDDIDDLQEIQTGITKQEVYANAVRLNNAVEIIRKVKNQTDESIESLLPLKVSENTAQYSCTIPSMGQHKRVFVRVGLHYGSKVVQNPSSYYDYDELYLEGNSKTDFSDVRFFDSNGNILKAEFGPLVNMELCADKRLDKILQVLSDGSLIAYDDATGMSISTDGGATFAVISGTYDVTQHGSNVYNRKSMYPVFVDGNDNIYAYAGGLLYKMLASDQYATKTQVCDFSWTNSGTTIYPDIQNHGMDMDTNGNLIFGTYAGTQYYHSDVFASTNGGTSFTLVWHNYNGEYQHIHHVHADKYSSKVYVGIDDDGSHESGSKIIVTDDGGSTWDDITDDFIVRGKDYYPTYFGNGFRLGSGEVFLMGSGSVYRSVDDSNLDVVIGGCASVRSFANFGNDDIIVCGSQSSSYVSENHIFISEDKGKTWESIYKRNQIPYDTSGIGYRDIKNSITLPGENEPCIIMPRGTGYVPSFKVYKGGSHWYREAFIEVENTTNSDIVIVAKCGYAIKYPYDCLENSETIKPVYRVPLNERIGSIISDSTGNVHSITGQYVWDIEEESVHYGDYSAPTKYGYMPSSGLEIAKGSYLNLGKVKELSFSDNFSFSFWVNFKARYLTQTWWDKRNSEKKIFSFGDVFLVENQRRLWLCSGSSSNHTGVNYYWSAPFYFTDGYFMLTFTVANGVMNAYINGSKITTRSDSGSFSISSNLSERDFEIRPSNAEYGYLSDICFYDKVLSDDEVVDIYRGW